MRKKLKKYGKDAMTIGTVGVGLGVMGSLPGSGGAVTKMSGALPTVGGIMGAGMVVDSLKGLQKSSSPKKKR
jgi:hypothetical protein